MELSANQPIPPDRRDEILRSALDQLVTYTVLSQESRGAQGIKVDGRRDRRQDEADAVAVPDRRRNSRRRSRLAA